MSDEVKTGISVDLIVEQARADAKKVQRGELPSGRTDLPELPKREPEKKEKPEKVSSYKFKEDIFLDELKTYIDSTYGQHYSGKYQATDMIIDAGHGVGFCVGNVMKYAKRYGKKNGCDRDDIMKILHYAIILLYAHEQEQEDAN
jgi:hypothetical protein